MFILLLHSFYPISENSHSKLYCDLKSSLKSSNVKNHDIFPTKMLQMYISETLARVE